MKSSMREERRACMQHHRDSGWISGAATTNFYMGDFCKACAWEMLLDEALPATHGVIITRDGPKDWNVTIETEYDFAEGSHPIMLKAIRNALEHLEEVHARSVLNALAGEDEEDESGRLWYIGTDTKPKFFRWARAARRRLLR